MDLKAVALLGAVLWIAAGPQEDSAKPAVYELVVGKRAEDVATYSLLRDGVRPWQQQLPFLEHRIVTDAGVLFGVAIRAPLLAGPSVRALERKLVLLNVRAGGEKEDLDSWRLRVANAPEGRLYPHCPGLILSADQDELLVRLQPEPAGPKAEESWRIYDAASGALKKTIDPFIVDRAPAGQLFLLDVRSLPVAEGWLANWWCSTPEKDYPASLSSRVVVLDADFQLVWSLDLVGDYELKGLTPDEQPRMRSHALKAGSLTEVKADGSFSVLRYDDRALLRFAVERRADGEIAVVPAELK